ncbi:ABC transporter ATP-binding protein [Salisediminibacterium beveridgei]|uniref:Dipeptide transport ATP-binding protein DppF n=1 Tax=Salisediminibacterium beveridgei TaxID=632773 RepID=A0A1D7QXC2_9BACI|nr:ATP-binding cassette domain-containing protein [Salisediminibacterium beveridgei]AOM83661.1 Dipeptide transport ATP-binding protein DppF [Salisediminibacterium beveridgei]
MILEAKNLGHYYNRQDWLFRKLNLEVDSGEVLGIKAPSGYGKTTIGKILAGLMSPVEGQVTLDGKAIRKKGYNPVQLIFQHPEQAVNPRFNMHDVLREAWDVDQQLMASFGIRQDWLARWPNELSGGELQRFCVLRALGPKTRVIIADEISTMLDALTQAKIWHVLLEQVKSRQLVLIVFSHDERLLERVCTRTIDLTQ